MDASLESLLFTELESNDLQLCSTEGEMDYVNGGTAGILSSKVIPAAIASMEDDANDFHFCSGMDYLNDEMFCSNDMASASLEDHFQVPFPVESAPSHYCVSPSDKSSTSARGAATSMEMERPLKKINVSGEPQKPAGSRSFPYVLSFEKSCTPLVMRNPAPKRGDHHVGPAMEVNDKAAFPLGNMNSPSPSSSSSKMALKIQKVDTAPIIDEAERPHSVSRVSTRGTDHIIAERLRREKLAELLIALSALIPGLKKTDKASVLLDAVKYVKHLQERVKLLEEQAKIRSTVDSVVCIKKTQLTGPTNEDDSGVSCNSSVENPNMDISGDETMPEVVVRVSDEKDVLIRIHCWKHNGVLVNIFSVMLENLHLSVVNSSALPFGDSRLEVTIVAQIVDASYKVTAMDIARSLRTAILPVANMPI